MSARHLPALMAALAARGLIAPGLAAGQQRLVEVRRVAADTLRDGAVTGIEDGRATIYYNPALLERLGAQFGDFIMAHEEGHVYFGHAGGALLTSQPDFAQVRQQQELDADCYAAPARWAGSRAPSWRRASRFGCSILGSTGTASGCSC
jgi:hypothetical protein